MDRVNGATVTSPNLPERWQPQHPSFPSVPVQPPPVDPPYGPHGYGTPYRSVPPPPPLEPRYKQTAHVAHFFICLVTFGLWAFVWVIRAVVNSEWNRQRRWEYEHAYRQWQQQYWEWQHGG